MVYKLLLGMRVGGFLVQTTLGIKPNMWAVMSVDMFNIRII